MRTVCNPINIEYRYKKDYFGREAADPLVVIFKGVYYMFFTNAYGYLYSDNLTDWKRIDIDPSKLDEFTKWAPATCVVGDRLYVTHFGDGNIYYSENPMDPDSWTYVSTPHAWADPAMIYEDGYVYVYHGSMMTGTFGIAKLDPNDNMKLVDEADIFGRKIQIHGFERLGQNNEKNHGSSYVEGAWVHKYNGKFYLTYAVPGTETWTYCDGCYVADDPMGPFEFCDNSPVVFKSTGYMRGCGHGCVFLDKKGRFWKVGTSSISINHWFERRINIFPMKTDTDGRIYVNTFRGDYPALAPDENDFPFEHNVLDWSLYSFEKPVRASSFLDRDHRPELALNENNSTWWSAKTGDPGEWIETDLGDIYDILGVQINFADQDIDNVEGYNCGSHRYVLEGSEDGKTYSMILDRRDCTNALCNEYVQLDSPSKARYVRLTSTDKTPAGGRLAISGLRLFGENHGSRPSKAPDFRVIRAKDGRDAFIAWDALDDAQGYYVMLGVNPNEMHTYYQVTGKSGTRVGTLNLGVDYYITVHSFNEGGITYNSRIEKI